MKRLRFFVFISHIVGWLIFLSLPLIFITGNGSTSVVDVLLQPYYWLCFLFFAAFFYVHTYLFIPFLYKSKKRLYYFLFVFISVAIALNFSPYDHLFSAWNHKISAPDGSFSANVQQPPPPERSFFRDQKGLADIPPADSPIFSRREVPPPDHRRNRPIDIVSLFMLLMAVAVSFAVDSFTRLRNSVQAATRAEVDKANAELSMLKTQIHPHFLFNTLNSIYALALTDKEHIAESILKLSNIMRYVTDEVSQNWVALENEVDCVTDFIDLQRLRVHKRTTVNYVVEGDMAGRRIPPLLLITFVENAFKYGISNHYPVEIAIVIKTLPTGVYFSCINSIVSSFGSERRGTGIANVKKRLAYLYPGKHDLIISNQEKIFEVKLTLREH